MAPSWRGAENPNERGPVRSWRRPSATGGTSWAGRSRWLRTIVGSVSTALGLGAIVLFIVLVNAPGCCTTASIVYAPAPYRNAGMPPDAFAPNDAAAFEATFHDTARLSPRLADSPSAASKTISAGADVAIIYVTALSGRNANGLFLYSSDADPDESDSLVPLERLRDQLAAMPAKQKN